MVASAWIQEKFIFSSDTERLNFEKCRQIILDEISLSDLSEEQRQRDGFVEGYIEGYIMGTFSVLESALRSLMSNLKLGFDEAADAIDLGIEFRAVLRPRLLQAEP